MTFEVNQEEPQYNFERSYENYKLFASATNAPGSLYSKPVALKAFETLLELEIIRPVKRTMDQKIPLVRFSCPFYYTHQPYVGISRGPADH